MRVSLYFVLLLQACLVIVNVAGSSGKPNPSRFKVNLPGMRYDTSDDDVDPAHPLGGSGRDFDLFDTRSTSLEEELNARATRNTSTSRKRAYRAYTPRRSGMEHSGPSLFQNVQEWWSVNLPNFPKLIFRVEPTTTLKISKTFRPLGTVVKLGADFNTNLGVWQFKSSWEDAIIGGKLTLAGKELQLSKSWQISMGKFRIIIQGRDAHNCCYRLHDFLADNFPFNTTITATSTTILCRPS